MSDPLILLPGMMCDARLFAPQIVALSANHSLHLAPLTAADTVEQLAEQVLARAPDRFAIAGHGLGGMVAMEIQRRAPERVSRIALIATNAQGETPSAAAAREEQIVKARAGRLGEAIQADLGPDDLADGPHRREILDMVLRMATDLGAEVYTRQSRAMQRRPDQQKTLRKLKIPTLVLCGEHDRICPRRRHEFIATLVRGARLEVVEGAGHLPSLEQPETVSRLLGEWLAAPLVLR